MANNVTRSRNAFISAAVAAGVSSIFFVAAGVAFYTWITNSLHSCYDGISAQLAALAQDQETMASRILIGNNSLNAIHSNLIKLREERIEENAREIQRRDNVEKRITSVADMLEAGIRRQAVVHDLMLRFLPPSWREELQRSMEADKALPPAVPQSKQSVSSEKL